MAYYPVCGMAAAGRAGARFLPLLPARFAA